MKSAVLLIHPPVNFDLAREPFMPSSRIGYGLLHIAACLLRRGYRVVVWNLDDAVRRGISPREVERGLKTIDPIVIGVEMNWLNLSRGAIQTAEILKKLRPDTPTIIGGTHATIFSDSIVQEYHTIIDGVLTGEAEKTFLRLVENVENKGIIGKVGGLVYFRNGRVRQISRKKDDLYENIDDLPPYTTKVIKNVTQGTSAETPFFQGIVGPSMAVETTRGPCRLKCIYCIGGRIDRVLGRCNFTTHSQKWIINQINLLIEEGMKDLTFQDQPFLSGKTNLLDLAKTLQREKIGEKLKGINMTAIPGILDGEVLEEMSKAGLNTIDYGVESGSNRILNLLNRPTSREAVLDAVKLTISKGVIPKTFWMTGFPGEKTPDLNETRDLILQTTKVGGIPWWITPLVIIPGTELFERAEDFGVKLRVKTFEDFTIYSNVWEKAVSWYPEAISHETENMTRYDILKASFDLKLEVYKRSEEIVTNFINNYAEQVISFHSTLTVNLLEQIIRENLKNLLKAFF
ncbi:radical SAM protein [Candidatus Bathyarchaeota archaeon]|nr:radical SAM protein [Candidatus Bathyarchaeota archaeon]